MGKTTALIEWARQDKRHVIVVHNHQEFHRLLHAYCYAQGQRSGEDVAVDGGALIGTWQLMTPEEAISHRGGAYPEQEGPFVYALDNIDLILPALFHHKIDVVTMTPEEESDDHNWRG